MTKNLTIFITAESFNTGGALEAPPRPSSLSWDVGRNRVNMQKIIHRNLTLVLIYISNFILFKSTHILFWEALYEYYFMICNILCLKIIWYFANIDHINDDLTNFLLLLMVANYFLTLNLFPNWRALSNQKIRFLVKQTRILHWILHIFWWH